MTKQKKVDIIHVLHFLRKEENPYFLDKYYAEKNLSTKYQKKEQNTRLSSTDENQGWSKRAEKTKIQKARKADCVVFYFLATALMLSGDHRLTKSDEIVRVIRKGRSVWGRFIGIKVLTNGKRKSRFAFIVSNKVSKSAVVRNSIKRQMREGLRANLSQIKQGVDVVITAKNQSVEAQKGGVRKEIENLLQKSRLI